MTLLSLPTSYVTMGAFDGAEVCELVGSFLLNLICERFPPTVEEEAEAVTLLSSSSGQTKTVSPLGFFLLELLLYFIF